MYILYKNPVQPDMLAVVRYLHFATGSDDVRPALIVECNHPEWAAASLPSIDALDGETGSRVEARGFDACVAFLERRFGVADLAAKAVAFAASDPGYTVNGRR